MSHRRAPHYISSVWPSGFQHLRSRPGLLSTRALWGGTKREPTNIGESLDVDGMQSCHLVLVLAKLHLLLSEDYFAWYQATGATIRYLPLKDKAKHLWRWHRSQAVIASMAISLEVRPPSHQEGLPGLDIIAHTLARVR